MKEISRRSFLKGSAAAGGLAAMPALASGPSALPRAWTYEADVVVVGGGGAGLPAAIGARDRGLSVIVVDANYDVGGHAIVSGGNVPLGGGTAQQKKYGIRDDPMTYFRDLTDWSVVETSGMPDYRYNDRTVQYAIAMNAARTYDFLVANGVRFEDRAPDNLGAHAVGISARREHHCVWKSGQCAESPAGAGGAALMRPLEYSARKKGVRFLLNYHMDEIFREDGGRGRVCGIQARYTPRILPDGKRLESFRSEGGIDCREPSVTVRARKAVVIATGGNSGNVEFRRIFDPRLTGEYANAAGEYSPQDASGELAAMAVGASLWGAANQAMDRNGSLRKRQVIGVRTNYVSWTKKSPVFPFVKYPGLRILNWQDAIIVNQAGRRFYSEFENGYPNGTHEGFYKDGAPYVQGSWRNTTRIKFRPRNYIDAALALNEGSKPPLFSAGPQWAVFDSKGAAREHMKIEPGCCDPQVFFSAPTIEELAQKINTSPWQRSKMDPKALAETVRRYNGFVDAHRDEDFDKPSPRFKIETGPFYAAWASFAVHDSYAGLRIDENCRVLDLRGRVIEGLYCGGESAGGCSQHGLGRTLTQGYIIGQKAGA
ncbi:FAD-binding protein [Mesosutterella sp. OilRF-GAM-744-9]|uniref:FAD-binding protein n=1 Tax=Mesosutterella porci TaxID=2915351 RepID=A0ABS9MTH2_9BURK|nr:FAD-binding protein [Mesosutterella sp. oilRF-744-WT-GAM-9]MCG5031923.1 FAD-binding protein [Mesosutterella sp. oilRF-744-WT-GAM-9]